MKIELLALKAKLRGFELLSRKLCKRIEKSKGTTRWALRFQKFTLGTYTRHHLIAYCLLRNRPYERLEFKCDERNKPNIERILTVIHDHVPAWERKGWSREKVEKLLERRQP